MSELSPAVILYNAAGVAMAVQDGVAVPANTDALLIAGKTSTGVARVAGLDTYTAALITIDVAHARVHDGKMFFNEDGHIITGAGTNLDFLISVGAPIPHLKYAFDADDAVSWVLYEGTTTSADGVAHASFNRNRNSVATPVTAISTGPTVTAVGTQISAGLLSASVRQGGSEDWSHEMLLKASTKYLLRFTKVGTGSCTLEHHFNWYEP